MSRSLRDQDVLRSSSEMSEIDWIMQLIIQRQGTCEKSGLVGLSIDPSNPKAAAPEIRLPSGDVYLKEGALAPSSKWTTKSLRFTNLSKVDSNIYVATLRLEGSYRDNSRSVATVQKELSRNYLFEIALDAAGKVEKCGKVSADQIVHAGNMLFDPLNNATFVSVPGPWPTLKGQSTAALIAVASTTGVPYLSFTPEKANLRLKAIVGYGYDTMGSADGLYVELAVFQQGVQLSRWNVVAASRLGTGAAVSQWFGNQSEVTGITNVTPNVPVKVTVSAKVTCNSDPFPACNAPDPNTSGAQYKVWSVLGYEITEFDRVVPAE